MKQLPECHNLRLAIELFILCVLFSIFAWYTATVMQTYFYRVHNNTAMFEYSRISLQMRNWSFVTIRSVSATFALWFAAGLICRKIPVIVLAVAYAASSWSLDSFRLTGLTMWGWLPRHPIFDPILTIVAISLGVLLGKLSQKLIISLLKKPDIKPPQ